jgi:NAD(P)-dependent dehydrogenase (short-subunit alcohol dehydrogenase family)
MGVLEGKVGFVTGAASGMGRAAAYAMAREGAKIAVADIDVSGGEKTAQTIQDQGGEAIFVRTDVTSAADVAALVERAVGAFGRLDYAFNNAGIITDDGPAAELSQERWDQVIAVNLTGVWLGTKYAIPAMLANGGGVIVNNASTVGLSGQTGTPAYVASKHGVIGLTRSTALEYGRQGIRVNAVCPGMTKTEMHERGMEELGDRAAAEEARYINDTPLRRLGLPEDVANAVVWLCSDAAAQITGHSLVIDGGDLAAWRTNYWW